MVVKIVGAYIRAVWVDPMMSLTAERLRMKHTKCFPNLKPVEFEGFGIFEINRKKERDEKQHTNNNRSITRTG